MFKLYARDGWGSVLVEAQLAWYGLEYDRIEVGDLFGSAEARKPFRANLDQYAQRLWQVLESAASVPWLLGQRFSALDIDIACMTQSRPGRAWLAEHAPRLAAAAAGTDKEAKLRGVLDRNFPTPP
jgi:glutathione S-transferase